MRVGKKKLALAAAWSGLTFMMVVGATAQENEVVAHGVSVTGTGATVTLELADGQEVSLSLGNGILMLNGAEVAEYEIGSEIEEAWRETLLQAGKLSTPELLEAISEWESSDVDIKRALSNTIDQLRSSALATSATAEMALAQAQTALAQAEMTLEGADIARIMDAERMALQVPQHLERLDELVIDLSQLGGSQRGLALQLDDVREQLEQVNNLGLQVEDARIHIGDITVPRGRTIENDLIVLAGDVSIFGNVEGNVIALDGDVILHRGSSVAKDIVTVNGRVTRGGGTIGGRVRSDDLNLRLRRALEPPKSRLVSPVSNGTSIASLIGMFVALSCIGFGFTFFGPRQLDVVSDTVSESFGKSFFAGLFATPLVPAAFVTMIIGLALTIVGILLIPFAIVGGILAIMAAATGGYLAVAKSVGSTYLNRRMAQGHAVTATPYKSLVIGLVGLMAIWLPAATLGWIPVMGPALAMLAAIFTWVMATAGFGAAILSRAGIRATFANSRSASSLTDEHYWQMDTGSHSIPPRTYRRSE